MGYLYISILIDLIDSKVIRISLINLKPKVNNRTSVKVNK